MLEHRGVQALSGRWRWAPQFGLDSTPYERACGVGGQCTLHRSWLSRWVRGVTVGTLWLGEPIANRVEDRAALAAAAKVTPLGTGLRVAVESATQLDAV